MLQYPIYGLIIKIYLGNRMNFNKSIIATFVGAAIASASMGAIASDTGAFLNAPAPVVSNQVATISGMSNQFDAQLGTNTFQWASAKNSIPNMMAVSAEHQNAFAADFYLKQLTGLSESKPSLAMPILANIHDIGRGAKIAKYKQEIAGIEVFNREYNIMMDREFNLVASSGYLASDKAVKSSDLLLKSVDSAFDDAASSVKAVFLAMGGDSATIKLTNKKSADKYEKFTVANTSSQKIILGEPRAKKVFFEHKNKIVAAHYVEVETGEIDSRESEYYGYVVAAKTGEVLFKNNLTSHAADFNYRVFTDAEGKPWDSPHGEVMPAPEGSDRSAFLTQEYLDATLISKSHGPISTGDAWLADDATMTMGNNVTAYVDAIAPQGFSNGDYMAEVTSSNTFDYKYDVSKAEYSVGNRKAAIVNLFYVNNYLHDDYYDHGFDELAGNAQTLNYGRGGEEGDALNVEVQDNSGFNNANMSTPADGGSPRMQMYLWETTQAVNGTDYGATVTSHADIGMISVLQIASFGAETFDVSGDLVRLEDATAPINNGCEAAVNGADLAGKIAVIDRGACAFTDKVLNAQAAGAIAVFIANNNNDGTPAPMGGGNDAVTIPSFGINFSDGAAIYALLDADEKVSVDMFRNDLSRVFKDSTWDNAIVAHEWGHYISNRLVGNSSGLSSQQARSMGEGFGDFHALMLTTDASDNLVLGNEEYDGGYAAITYVASFVDGIRPYPYSTDTTINPSTFGDIGLYPDLVHSPGSIFSNMIWESFISMVNDERHTFDEAKNLIKDYVVAGYKMMPMAPTFTEGRDAILSAAYANDVEDYNLMLAAFAKRGMGLGAKSPSRFATDHAGAVESYATTLSSFSANSHMLNTNYEGLTSGYCSKDSVLDKGETATVSFTIQNRGSETYENITAQIEVVGDQDVTFANEGVVTFDSLGVTGSATSSPIEFTLNDASMAEDVEFKVTFPGLTADVVNDYSFTTKVNYDFKDRAPVGSSTVDDMETLSSQHDFMENVIGGGEAAAGTGYLDTRFAGALGGVLGQQYLFINNNGFESDVAYETRAFSVGFDGDFVINWFHYYDFEANWDGGVVEVSVNGGDWADVTEMGGTFLGGGYNENPIFTEAGTALSERLSFTDFAAGYEGVSFGEALNGNEVKFRFRAVSDFTANNLGWLIDGVQFDNVNSSIFSDVVAGDSVACDNRAPIVTAVTDVERIVREGISVSMSVEATDPNGDALTYSWEQTSGPTVTLAGSNTAAISFTSPSIESGSETLTFVASVNDGTVDATQSFSVVVNDMPSMVPARKNSSGGSTGLLAFLLLPLALLRRRKK